MALFFIIERKYECHNSKREERKKDDFCDYIVIEKLFIPETICLKNKKFSNYKTQKYTLIINIHKNVRLRTINYLFYSLEELLINHWASVAVADIIILLFVGYCRIMMQHYSSF